MPIKVSPPAPSAPTLVPPPAVAGGASAAVAARASRNASRFVPVVIPGRHPEDTEANFVVPKDWQQVAQNQNLNVPSGAHLEAVKQILDSPHFSPAQKYAIWRIATDKNNTANFNLAAIILEAHSHVPYCSWTSPLLEKFPLAQDIAANPKLLVKTTSATNMSPGIRDHLITNFQTTIDHISFHEMRMIAQENHFSEQEIDGNQYIPNADCLGLIFIGDLCRRYIGEGHVSDAVVKILYLYTDVVEELLKAGITIPQAWWSQFQFAESRPSFVKKMVDGRWPVLERELQRPKSEHATYSDFEKHTRPFKDAVNKMRQEDMDYFDNPKAHKPFPASGTSAFETRLFREALINHPELLAEDLLYKDIPELDFMGRIKLLFENLHRFPAEGRELLRELISGSETLRRRLHQYCSTKQKVLPYAFWDLVGDIPEWNALVTAEPLKGLVNYHQTVIVPRMQRARAWRLGKDSPLDLTNDPDLIRTLCWLLASTTDPAVQTEILARAGLLPGKVTIPDLDMKPTGVMAIFDRLPIDSFVNFHVLGTEDAAYDPNFEQTTHSLEPQPLRIFARFMEMKDEEIFLTDTTSLAAPRRESLQAHRTRLEGYRGQEIMSGLEGERYLQFLSPLVCDRVRPNIVSRCNTNPAPPTTTKVQGINAGFLRELGRPYSSKLTQVKLTPTEFQLTGHQTFLGGTSSDLYYNKKFSGDEFMEHIYAQAAAMEQAGAKWMCHKWIDALIVVQSKEPSLGIIDIIRNTIAAYFLFDDLPETDVSWREFTAVPRTELELLEFAHRPERNPDPKFIAVGGEVEFILVASYLHDLCGVPNKVIDTFYLDPQQRVHHAKINIAATHVADDGNFSLNKIEMLLLPCREISQRRKVAYLSFGGEWDLHNAAKNQRFKPHTHIPDSNEKAHVELEGPRTDFPRMLFDGLSHDFENQAPVSLAATADLNATNATRLTVSGKDKFLVPTERSEITTHENKGGYSYFIPNEEPDYFSNDVYAHVGDDFKNSPELSRTISDEQIRKYFPELDEVRKLSEKHRVRAVQAFVAKLHYKTDMTTVPGFEALIAAWENNPSRFAEYWEIILSTGQARCNEIAFVAVELLRAVNVPCVYASGQLVKENGDISSEPHRHVLVATQDEDNSKYHFIELNAGLNFSLDNAGRFFGDLDLPGLAKGTLVGAAASALVYGALKYISLPEMAAAICGVAALVATGKLVFSALKSKKISERKKPVVAEPTPEEKFRDLTPEQKMLKQHRENSKMQLTRSGFEIPLTASDEDIRAAIRFFSPGMDGTEKIPPGALLDEVLAQKFQFQTGYLISRRGLGLFKRELRNISGQLDAARVAFEQFVSERKADAELSLTEGALIENLIAQAKSRPFKVVARSPESEDAEILEEHRLDGLLWVG